MKVGDYVRLQNSLYGTVVIYKIMEILENTILIENDGSIYEGEYSKEEIIKSSPNIIDLIEVGDYVNGRYVDKYQGKLGNFCELPNGKWEFIEISNEHYLISSIVTREQFENCMYKIGE